MKRNVIVKMWDIILANAVVYLFRCFNK